MAFGGSDGENMDVDSVEEWGEEEEGWRRRGEKLEEARYYFGYTSAPTSSVCT